MEMKIKVWGAVLVVLGLITGICAMYLNSHAPAIVDLQFAYKSGMFIGSAITECAIGTLMLFFPKES